MNLKKNKKASAIIEYAVLILLFIGAIVAMNQQVRRVFFGRWKEMGDRFGYGQQYDPAKTLECGRYAHHDPESGEWQWELWYHQECYSCCMNKNGPDVCLEFDPSRLWWPGTLTEIRGFGEDYRRLCCAKACETNECKDED